MAEKELGIPSTTPPPVHTHARIHTFTICHDLLFARSDVKRYDRQIRLWGMETQRGILGARILVLEFTGLCNEIVKNLVLAGVGHICIQDSGLVVQSDVNAGGVFSFAQPQVGKNRAEAAVEALHPMNPSVASC